MNLKEIAKIIMKRVLYSSQEIKISSVTLISHHFHTKLIARKSTIFQLTDCDNHKYPYDSSLHMHLPKI